MWLATVAESVAQGLAFYLSMHNAGGHEGMRDFIAAFPTPEKRSLREMLDEMRGQK